MVDHEQLTVPHIAGVPGEGYFCLSDGGAVGWTFRRFVGFVVGGEFSGWMREAVHWFWGRTGPGIPLA